MTFDDRATHGQPNAHAFRLGAVERREELLRVPRIEAHAAVTDGDAHETVFVEPRPDEQVAGPILDREHGVGGIREQVQNDLLQLDPIADDNRKVAGEVRAQERPLALQLAATERNHFACGLGQVHWLGGGLFLCE